MTAGEITTHLLAALGSAGPAIGAFISERTKRKTAEAQTTEHVAHAISDATAGLRVTLETTAGIAKAAMAKATESEKVARECESGREAEQKACADSVGALRAEAKRAEAAMNNEIRALHDLITDLTPSSSTIHHGVVE